MNISTNISAGKKLSTLSDSQLISRLQLLCKQERRTTLNIILHLAEIDERRAYLQRGYWSLFDYCTRALGYSESAAGRRIRTARCVRNFPEVYLLLLNGKLNLTVVSRIAGILTRDNVDRLVLVDDLQLRQSMGLLFAAMKIAVEPACAASTAALFGPLRERLRGKTVMLVFCGSNMDWATFQSQAIFEDFNADR